MLRERWLVLGGVAAVAVAACSARNPAFDPDASAEGGTELGEGADELGEDGEGEFTGEDEAGMDGGADEFGDEGELDLPEGLDCLPEVLEVRDAVFVVHTEQASCGGGEPVPCDELAFGATPAFQLYGLTETGNPESPWRAGPAAAYLLVHFDDSDIRGQDWLIQSATMFLDATVFEQADGLLQARVMTPGEAHNWNGATGGDGQFPLAGETTFKYRQFPDITWNSLDPAASAADLPLGGVVVEGGDVPMSDEFEIELGATFFRAFLAQEFAESNGMLLTFTDPGPFVFVDSMSIRLEFEICEEP